MSDPGFRVYQYEAVCLGCGETFVPNDEDDLIHGEREDGTPCGEEGTLTGAYGIPIDPTDPEMR